MERCLKTGIELLLVFKFCLYFCLTVLKLIKVVSTFYERTAVVILKQKPSKFKKSKYCSVCCVLGLKISSENINLTTVCGTPGEPPELSVSTVPG